RPPRPARHPWHRRQVITWQLHPRHRTAKNPQERNEHDGARPDEEQVKRRRQVVASTEGMQWHERHGEHDSECSGHRFFIGRLGRWCRRRRISWMMAITPKMITKARMP